MIKPVLHRVLVKPQDVEESDDVLRRAKAAGIHLELDKREKAAVEIAEVVLVGTTCFEQFGSNPMSEGVVPGAKVYFAKYAGKEVKDNNVRYLILNDEDIVGVISND